MNEIYVIMHTFQDYHEGDWHTELFCNSFFLTEEAAEKAKARLISEYEEDGYPLDGELYVKRLSMEE